MPLQVALLTEGVDRNTPFFLLPLAGELSPFSRRAWIEIFLPQISPTMSVVALLTEGVDRNTSGQSSAVKQYVALLTEGVDRNDTDDNANTAATKSPFSRRAWIEIALKLRKNQNHFGRPSHGGRG